MNIYRNQTSPFFYCTPLCQEAVYCGEDSSWQQPVDGYRYSASQWMLSRQLYQNGDSLRWTFCGGDGAALSPDGTTFSLTPGTDYLVSYLIQGNLPPQSTLGVLPYFGTADPEPYASYLRTGDAGGWVNLAGGFLLPGGDPLYLTVQLQTDSPSPVEAAGFLHLFPLPRR